MSFHCFSCILLTGVNLQVIHISSQNVESAELGFQIQIFSGILDSLSFIPDSKVQNSRFHEQKLPRFWDLDSLT